jgi:hypothetical protein
VNALPRLDEEICAVSRRLIEDRRVAACRGALHQVLDLLWCSRRMALLCSRPPTHAVTVVSDRSVRSRSRSRRALARTRALRTAVSPSKSSASRSRSFVKQRHFPTTCVSLRRAIEVATRTCAVKHLSSC